MPTTALAVHIPCALRAFQEMQLITPITSRLRAVVRRCASLPRPLLFWFTQRIFSVSLLCLITALYFSFWADSRSSSGITASSPGYDEPYFSNINKRSPTTVACHVLSRTVPGAARAALLIYSICVHLLAAAFPIRAFYALRGVIKQLKETADDNDQRGRKGTPGTQGVRHIVLVLNYKEDIHTLRQTLGVLAAHWQAQSSYEIVLAMEDAEEHCEHKAELLVTEFKQAFYGIDYTIHPSEMAGEARGKSSNLAWAARSVCRSRLQSRSSPEQAIVTIMDADSYLSSDYFSLISTMHINATGEAGNMTIYVPPIVFDRHANSVPRLIRVADIVWAAAGLSGFLPSDTIRPPTSVYSLPLGLVDQVGGWDAGPEAIGEDLHMYLECYWHLSGNLISKIVPSAASHTDISSTGGTNAIRDWALSHRARYNQAIRHMWGSLYTGYALQMLFGSFWGFETAPQPVTDDHDDEISTYKPPLSPIHTAPPNYRKHTLLFLRLFEAHMLPVHLILLGLNSTFYNLTILHEDLAVELAWEFSICGYLRAFGFIGMICVLFSYKEYQEASVKKREREMEKSSVQQEVCKPTILQHLLDICIFPIAGTLFGSLPVVVAQLRQLYFLELNYTVSAKPGLQRVDSGHWSEDGKEVKEV